MNSAQSPRPTNVSQQLVIVVAAVVTVVIAGLLFCKSFLFSRSFSTGPLARQLPFTRCSKVLGLQAALLLLGPLSLPLNGRRGWNYSPGSCLLGDQEQPSPLHLMCQGKPDR